MTRLAPLLLIAALLVAGCPEDSYNMTENPVDSNSEEDGVQGGGDAVEDATVEDTGPPFNKTLGWKVLNTGANETWNTIYGVELPGGDYQVFVGGALGTVMYYASADKKWHHIDTASSLNVASIWAEDASYVVIAGEGGLLKRYYKYGDKPDWYNDDLTTGIFKDLNAVHGLKKDALWAVGAKGTILRFNGTEWSKMDPSVLPLPNDLPDLYSVHVIGPDDVLLGGKGVVAWLHQGTWSVDIYTFKDNEVKGIFSRDGKVWMAAGKGMLYQIDMGSAYNPHQPNVYSLFDSIWISPSGKVYAGASSPPPIVWVFDGNKQDAWEDLAVESPKFIKDKYPTRIVTNTRVSGIWGTGDENIFACTKEKQVLQYAVHD